MLKNFLSNEYNYISLVALTLVSRNSFPGNPDEMCTETGQCKFPFNYHGKKFTECTKEGGYDIPWCYTKDSWGFCKPCRGKYICDSCYI